MIHQQELLQNILSRLPAKSIGRFRCVSKPWKSLLTQPHFIKTHLNRTKRFPREEESIILVSDESKSLYSIKLKYPHQIFDNISTFATKLNLKDYKFATIEDQPFLDNTVSCDGLILVKDEDDKLLLVNPTTREIKVLPPSPCSLKPGHCTTMYGLGYDSLNDDYKVVTLSYIDDPAYCDEDNSDNDGTEVYVNIYYVKKGIWRRDTHYSPYDHLESAICSGAFVDGFIHWIASVLDEKSRYVIVAFDVQDEEYYETPSPSAVHRYDSVSNHLVSLGGCLCMFNLKKKNYESDIWVMEEYDVEKSWTNFSVPDSDVSEYRPLCLLGKDQMVLLKDESSSGAKLVMYNKEDERSIDIVVQGIPNGFGFGWTFLETLVSPHGSSEATS